MFLINGQPDDYISVQDRGLHFGDGLFETIAVNNRKLLCWGRHFDRLRSGCDQLGIPCPGEEILLKEANRLIEHDERCVIKIIVTRGTGKRGYQIPQHVIPTRIVAIYPWPDYPQENVSKGVKIRVCKMRMSRNGRLAGIKHLNRLEQILARSEWDDPEIAEGVVLDTEDNVIEGTMSNLFLVYADRLVTPDLEYCGIRGIIRQCIIEMAADNGLDITIKEVKYDDLLAAEALFLCNSTFGIWPVRQLDDHAYRQCNTTDKIRQALIEKECITG